jgi:hypothetical protein
MNMEIFVIAEIANNPFGKISWLMTQAPAVTTIIDLVCIMKKRRKND